jgi:hypothetical protein
MKDYIGMGHFNDPAHPERVEKEDLPLTPDEAVAEFKEALMEHFNKFPIPTQIGVVAIMKHIEKVFQEKKK